jgi:hypothetical protein
MAELTDEQKDSGGQPLEAVVNAAKVAAASAAVGAAAAAAKALASRHDEDEEQATAEPEPEQQPEEEDEEPRAEQPHEPEQHEQEEPEEEDEEPVEGAPLGDARSAARHAREQLEELLGKPVESVSSLERTHDGWVVALEVVELQRVPESTDVLASYELELDGDLNFRRYQQARRYHRAQADRGDEA